jgi:uncharacterized protein with NRDE domain
LLAANRDEMLARPSRTPGRHWPDRPNVVAGMDEQAGGTWLGLNDEGIVAAVMNRVGSLGPAPDARSRGELVLEALDHADATAAAEALAALNAPAYRAFNLIVADDRDAYWIKGLGRHGPARVEVAPIPAGYSMLTARDLNDTACPRIRTFKPRFEAAPVPDPEADEWTAWAALLATRGRAGEIEATMTIEADARGFGTVSASLLAIPDAARAGAAPLWRFAAGRPDRAPFVAVDGVRKAMGALARH